MHSGKEEFTRGRGGPCPLEPEDFLPLAADLQASMLFIVEEFVGSNTKIENTVALQRPSVDTPSAKYPKIPRYYCIYSFLPTHLPA
jgi:hypothetical protein